MIKSETKVYIIISLLIAAIPACAGWYAKRRSYIKLGTFLYIQSWFCLGFAFLLFVSFKLLQRFAPHLLRFLGRLSRLLGPVSRYVSEAKILGPLVSMAIRLVFFAWFGVLIASDHLVRALIGHLVGQHASRQNLSIVNAVQATFPLFEDALDKQEPPQDVDLAGYSQSMAYTLAAASRLAYENVAVVQYELRKDHFDVDRTFLPLAYKNICAYIVEKDDVIFLVFRGTNPMNIQNFVTDFNIGMKQVHLQEGSMGNVHQGFWDAMGESGTSTLAPHHTTLRIELSAASLYRTVSSTLQAVIDIVRFAAEHLVHHVSDPIDNSWAGLDTDVRFHSMYAQAEKWAMDLLAQPPQTPGKTKQLYITGHSLGGALATIFLAKMLQNNSPLLASFGGLYTFGQPKIGDADFSRAFPPNLTRRIFHHAYNNDIVTRVPPPLLHPYATPPGTLVFIDAAYNITLHPPHPHTLEPVPVKPISFLDLAGLLNGNVIRRLPQETWLRILFRIVFPFFINDHFPSEYCSGLARGHIIPALQEFEKDARDLQKKMDEESAPGEIATKTHKKRHYLCCIPRRRRYKYI